MIRDIRTLFEQQEEDYYKPERVSNFWNNNYIEYPLPQFWIALDFVTLAFLVISYCYTAFA